MKFKSLSVLDFIEESKGWSAIDFIDNVYLHKEELKKLDVETPDSIYYGCGKEIWHLIDFCRKILFFKEYQKYPAGMSDNDYRLMIEIFDRYIKD